MPLIAYKPIPFREETLWVIDHAVAICELYESQGYQLTLRQLFYQFVSRDLISNTHRDYKRLGTIVNDARIAGMLDWNHISDRTRNLGSVATWDDPSSIIRASASQFKRDVWSVSGQLSRPEVWVEKDALVDVVSRASDPLFAPYFSCRGYVSQSEMWVAGRRMRQHILNGFEPVVFHMGDHDPSGIDMSRDIEDRLSTFAGHPIRVERITLDMAQIHQYSPPPNPAKLTDSRAKEYVKRFGTQSWELDALEPSVLAELITRHVTAEIDDPVAWQQVLDEDEDTRLRMQDMADRWDDIYPRWGEIEDLLDA